MRIVKSAIVIKLNWTEFNGFTAIWTSLWMSIFNLNDRLSLGVKPGDSDVHHKTWAWGQPMLNLQRESVRQQGYKNTSIVVDECSHSALQLWAIQLYSAPGQCAAVDNLGDIQPHWGRCAKCCACASSAPCDVQFNSYRAQHHSTYLAYTLYKISVNIVPLVLALSSIHSEIWDPVSVQTLYHIPV